MDELIAEFAGGIVVAERSFELREPSVLRLDARGRDREELGPMRARAEGLQLRFDEGEDLADLGPLGFHVK